MSKINELFDQKISIVNIGLESFYKELKSQNVEAIQVDWRPPAGGNKKMISLLSKLKSK
ncbi:MAG: fdrA domain protein [Clostridiales bacterium]|nr:fdrA domain protein [Clostridiales bacterium]